MTRKLRLLHIGNGGAFKIKAIVDAMLARGHEVHVVPVPPMAKAFAGTVWHEMPSGAGLGTLTRLLRVRRLISRIRPDVVHAHNAWGPGWYAAFAGLHPFVVHAYGGDLLPEQYRGRPLLHRALTSWTCRLADRVIVTGEHMVAAARLLGVEPERCVVIPRGVDVNRFRPGLETANLRRELGIDDDAFVVLSPRYQVDESLYNLDVVVEAVAALRAVSSRVVCVQMYGAKREEGVARLRSLVAEKGLTDIYRFVSAVDNSAMPAYYNLADVTVSVPSSDGFPVTVLEASACGCPLIVSDLSYCREWFEPGVNGVIVPAGDAGSLAGALADLAADDDRRRRIGRAGRSLVLERANYERCMDRLEALYLELLGEEQAALRGAH